MNANNRPAWARALTDKDAFEHEQAQLGQVWTLLGLTTDIPNDGDWFRATLGGRSVFVQRFGDTLRGFQNRCAHRFYPLRTEDKGNGVIRCGFHHWQYDKEGRAIGIPKCQEMFGVTPRELGARLNPLEIATCGVLVFGRFPATEATETLEQFLGEAFTVLQAFCGPNTRASRYTREIAANWKLCVHLSEDEYHIVAVHPESFGKHGYIEQRLLRYFRIRRHSAFFSDTGDDNALADMLAKLCDGSYRPERYCIFHIFPNFAANHVPTLDRWYVTLHQYVPVTADRSLLRVWYFPAPFPPARHGWLMTLGYGYLSLWLRLAVRYLSGKVFREDQEVSERQQTIAHQIDGLPILGAQEERIVWFEEAYREAMAAAPTPPPPQAAAVRSAVEMR
jgi:phenylpropionate dioxygenase-like ring-hydroxylating dioxygenase large terminal subunit